MLKHKHQHKGPRGGGRVGTFQLARFVLKCVGTFQPPDAKGEQGSSTLLEASYPGPYGG
jgi:hypothetical protein